MRNDFWSNIISLWIVPLDPELLERNNEIIGRIAEQFSQTDNHYETLAKELADFCAGGDDVGWVD